MSRVAIFGGNGQVGQAAAHILGEKAVVFTREEADFTDPASLKALVLRSKPSVIVNAAAYTAVDKAESEEEVAFKVNAASPQALAEAARELGIPLIHYSTDYVFDGSGTHARNEMEPTAPLNAYGRSKLAGEQAIAAIGGDYLIFRTSWVYDATGKNFLNTMLRLADERETISVVADQIGAPTYAPHLAFASLEALRHVAGKAFPSGVYHLCNAGETSWHGFALTIFEAARRAGQLLAIREVNPIASSAYPTPAARPLNSRLDCSKARAMLGITLPSWQHGLDEAIEVKFG